MYNHIYFPYSYNIKGIYEFPVEIGFLEFDHCMNFLPAW